MDNFGGGPVAGIRRCASLGEQLGYSTAPAYDNPTKLVKRLSRDGTFESEGGLRGITAEGHWRGDSLADLRIKTDALLADLRGIENLKFPSNGASLL